MVFAQSAKGAALQPRQARAVSFTVQAINGLLFERWLLKTVINHFYLVPEDAREPWVPPNEWVEIVFGIRPFPEKCGLYLVVGGVRQMRRSGDVRFALRRITYPKTQISCGGQVVINDWELIVSLIPLKEEGVSHHPRFLRLKHRRKTFRVLRFDWVST